MATGFPPPPIKSPISKDLVSADWARWFSNLNQGISGSLPIPFTLGDILYASGTLNLAKLPGNITATRKFLTQTGTGSVSAAPSWRPIGADDIPDAVIINPLILGRNVIRPASNAIEGLAIKAFSSPVSYLASGDWTIKGGGLVFGSTITQNTAGTPQTSYAYAPIADMANLSVTYVYTVTDTKNTSLSNYSCLGGAGVVGRNVNTANPPHNQSASGNPYGAWTSDTVGSIRHFIGTNNDGVYVSSGLVEDQAYSGTITITIGPNKGGNKYDVTIRTQVPFASIDHTEIIIDGVDNGGGGTNGYLVIAGSYTPAVDNAYSISSILSGALPTQKSFEIRKADNTVNAYVDWDGTGSFYDILASHQSTLGTVVSGIWHGTSIDTAYTDAKIKTVTGTANRLTIGGTSTDPTFNISTAYVGQNTITTLGTIATGVWSGTTIAVNKGGTGATTLAANGVLYGNAASAILALAVNSTATNKFLTQSSSAAPAWGTIAASDLPSSFSGLADPSGSIGLTAVNGIATTALRSDGTHALSQAIVPTWSGIHTFTLKPIMSSLTASQAVFSDGAKGLVSNAITGTGNVVMSAGPTLTGTITASLIQASSRVNSDGATDTSGYGLNTNSRVSTNGGFGYFAFGLGDPAIRGAGGNTEWLGLNHDGTNAIVSSQKSASGAYRDLVFQTSSSTRYKITAAGDNVFNSAVSMLDSVTLTNAQTLLDLVSTTTGNPSIIRQSANSAQSVISKAGTSGTDFFSSGTAGALQIGTLTNLPVQIGINGAIIFTLSSSSLTLNSDIKMNTAGNGLYVKEGSNATMGIATLVLGTATVSTTKVTANSRIFLSVESLGTISSPVSVSVTARSAGTSFTITSANLTDTSTVAWVIIEPA